MKETKVKTKTETELHFRKPNLEDGAAVWELVKDTGVLDLNSSYSYIMWCEIFSKTSIVAQRGRETVGFISGFIHPETPNTLYTWQIAVNESEQGKGLGEKMLFQLLKRDYDEPIRYIEATVSSSNTPSNELFWGLSKKLNCNCIISDYILTDHFPEVGHEAEILFRIGPLNDR